MEDIQGISTFIDASVVVTKSIYKPHCNCKALTFNLYRNAISPGIKWTDVRLEDKPRPQNTVALALALAIHLLVEKAHRKAWHKRQVDPDTETLHISFSRGGKRKSVTI